jgi:hypothetical protein
VDVVEVVQEVGVMAVAVEAMVGPMGEAEAEVEADP